MTWGAFNVPGSHTGSHTGEVHIIPLEDLRDHAIIHCWCDPSEDEISVFTHHSLDGREAFENGDREPS